MASKFTILFIVLLSVAVIAEANRDKNKEDAEVIVKFLRRLFKNTAIYQPGPLAASLTVGESNECADRVTWCSDYTNYCYHQTVQQHCMKTCKKCPEVKSNVPCEDTHPNCGNAVGWGYCTGTVQEVNQMKQLCRKSCGFCAPVECKDKRSDSYCQQIKRLNYCQSSKYREYFRKSCAATCGFCTGSCGISEIRKEVEQVLDQTQLEKNKIDIVAGRDASKGFYPWQVAIYHKEEFLCGGSLVGTTKIVTAAHCFNHRSKDVTEYRVVLGEHNRRYAEGSEQNVAIKQIIIHGQYHFDEDDHDIAILTLREKARLGKYITPICLAKKDAVLQPGRKCVLTGWGKIVHVGDPVDLLQEVLIPIGDRGYCEQRNAFNAHTVTENMVCAGFSDGSSFASGCHGDSGGPLQCEEDGKWTLYGVVSWGSPQCNGLDRFTVFTRVSKYVDWINEQN